MTDASLASLSQRGRLALAALVAVVMLLGEPKEFFRVFGWRFCLKAAGAIAACVLVALAWHPQFTPPPYALPACATLLYAAILWLMVERALRHTAEDSLDYHRGASERAMLNWAECDRRLQALEYPPPPPPHPDQLALPLEGGRTRRKPARRMRVKLD